MIYSHAFCANAGRNIMLNSENVLGRSGEMTKCKNNFPYVCAILSSKPQDPHIHIHAYRHVIQKRK